MQKAADANGASGTGRATGPDGEPPATIVDLAEACVRFVERALSIKLDYQPETLPVLDHYVRQARAVVSDASAEASKSEVEPLVARAVGAYFGEVVRRRHRSWWRAEDDDPLAWELQLEAVYLSLRPIELAHASLHEDERGGEDGERADTLRIHLLEQDREAVAQRLADLPEVSEEEFRSLSTVLEVVDIAVDVIRGRRAAAGEPPVLLGPRDYDTPSSGPAGSSH